MSIGGSSKANYPFCSTVGTREVNGGRSSEIWVGIPKVKAFKVEGNSFLRRSICNIQPCDRILTNFILEVTNVCTTDKADAGVRTHPHLSRETDVQAQLHSKHISETNRRASRQAHT